MNNVVSKYQAAFADWFKVKNAFAFWKGRVAVYAILRALDVKDGDEVILPGYTCVVNVNPIKYLGAKPVYIDIEPNTFNMNVDLLEGKITPKTKVIIAQHTYGYVCAMDEILTIAQKYNVPVIEDCCLCLGSTYKNKPAGTFGKAAYFSFQWNKPFTTGLGGMAITNDDVLAGKIERICQSDIIQPHLKETLILFAQLAVYRTFIYPSTTALAQNLFRYLSRKGVVVGSSSNWESQPKMAPDFFKAMSSIQARSGLKQLEKIDRNISHRREIAELYDSLLMGKGWMARRYDRLLMEPVMVRYPLRIVEKDKALEEAAGAGVELGAWFESPLHPRETFLSLYNYEIGMCPQAEKASREAVNLPLHPRITEKTARKTVSFITCFTEAK